MSPHRMPAVLPSLATSNRVRYSVLIMLFVATTVNYADRATLSLAGPFASKELGLTPILLGYAFAAFGWTYAFAQIPGGWLLDRFGSKRVYTYSILAWSAMTCVQGFVGWVPFVSAFAS